ILLFLNSPSRLIKKNIPQSLKRTGPTIFLFHKKILSSNSERKNSMLTVKLRRLLNSIDFFVD
ncbi:hypothetical protein, partial [Leptospira kirschneri]|uniref:hypothetical protein n=1 Tax=Leptospira kirschneri TaxID=29507 RepID=UPI0005B25FFE